MKKIIFGLLLISSWLDCKAMTECPVVQDYANPRKQHILFIKELVSGKEVNELLKKYGNIFADDLSVTFCWGALNDHPVSWRERLIVQGLSAQLFPIFYNDLQKNTFPLLVPQYLRAGQVCFKVFHEADVVKISIGSQPGIILRYVLGFDSNDKICSMRLCLDTIFDADASTSAWRKQSEQLNKYVTWRAEF